MSSPHTKSEVSTARYERQAKMLKLWWCGGG